MRALSRLSPSAGQVPLATGWAMLRGGDDGAPPQPDAPWRDIPGPMPVAAAWAAAGEAPLEAADPPDLDGATWWYRCRFDRPGPAGAWRLGLDGLATLASVSLNGRPLLSSRNMFRAHVVELAAGELLATGNELLIRFDPLTAALSQRRPRPRWRVPMLAHQQLRWWRTTLLGRTPGWSPAVAVVGPWRPVWLAPSAAPHCVHLALTPTVTGTDGRLKVAVAWADDSGLRSVRAQLQCGTPAAPDAGGPAKAPAASTAPKVPTAPTAPTAPSIEQALQRGADGVWSAELQVPDVQRWWPHTHGEPALYALQLMLDGEAGWPAALPAGRVGFRSLQLDRTDDGFRLLVNEVPVFARGACWTPLDSLRLHAAPAAYAPLFARLQKAGLNMLRVGGTMAYESADFLDACDEHGILLWQDLMFASMDYPGDDPDFLAEVDTELAQQLAAWQGRPALAVICGNSEVAQQAAMWGAPRADWQPALFHDHLPARVAQALPHTLYWPSSAHGGALPFQPAVGTTSYYGVGAYRRAPDDARHSQLRFATECLAFANVPADATLARLRELNQGRELRVHSALWKSRSPRDLGAGWDFDDVRDHYIEQLFGERADTLRAHDPARHLMLARAAVAELMRGSFNQWRAAGSRCGGALVWFLRDLRAGAGWGVLDDALAPKSAWHGLASAWQPRHLGLVDDGLNGVTLHLANDAAEAVTGSLEATWLQGGRTVVAQGQTPVTVPGRAQVALPAQALLDSFVDATWAYRFGPPVADVLWVRWLDAQGQGLAERLMFLPGHRAAAPADLGLTAQARVLPDGSREVSLRCSAAARGVHLVAEGWQADHEFFDLPPGVDRPMRVRPVPTARPAAWRVMVQAVNGQHAIVVPEGAG